MSDPCRSEDRLARHEALLKKLDAGRYAMYQWLMISAAIAVLLLTYHQFQAVVKMSGIAGMTEQAIREQNNMIMEQNRILNQILAEQINHNFCCSKSASNSRKEVMKADL